MGKTLFIIGNGFDRYHGLPTSYDDYRKFLLQLSCSNAGLLPRGSRDLDFDKFPYFADPECGRWSAVEEALEIDYRSLINDALDAGYPKITDDNPGWNDAEIDIESQSKFIFDFTGEQFVQWLKSIEVEVAKPKVAFPKSAAFVTFNYTDTLETIYGVSGCDILHIHGSIKEFDPDLWLAEDVISPSELLPVDGFEAATIIQNRADINHDEVAPSIQFGNPNNNPGKVRDVLEREYGDDEFYGAVIEPCVKLAAKYANAAYKDLTGNFAKLLSFLNGKDIDKVVVFGHSFDGIDEPYYSEVFIPKFRHLPWVFTSYSEDDCRRANDFCLRLGINDFSMTEVKQDMRFDN